MLVPVRAVDPVHTSHVGPPGLAALDRKLQYRRVQYNVVVLFRLEKAGFLVQLLC